MEDKHAHHYTTVLLDEEIKKTVLCPCACRPSRHVPSLAISPRHATPPVVSLHPLAHVAYLSSPHVHVASLAVGSLAVSSCK